MLLPLLLCLSLSNGLAQLQNVENLRVWQSPDSTRIVFDVSARMQYETFMLSGPTRLVVDLEPANLSIDLPKIDPDNRHIKSVRSGSPNKGVLRVVFDLKTQVTLNSFILTPNELYGHRLVLDLSDTKSDGSGIARSNSDEQSASTSLSNTEASSGVSSGVSSEASVPDVLSSGPDAPTSSVVPTGLEGTQADQAEEIKSNADVNVLPRAPVVITEPKRDARFVVAIDAGHGGDDPGAIGHRRTLEKKLTLSIAQKLQRRIDADPRMRAVMVRTGDYFVNLKDRRRKSSKQGADIFISIHADAFTKKSANGMSVFALSQRGATSAMASALAEKANASDLIGGVSLADKEEVVAKVLVDLSMTNTISESVNLGGRVLRELSKLGRLHSKRVEQANFSVLRSPDIPSILVETGFITNPNDEKKLRSKKHQEKLAGAIYAAVGEYLDQTPYASRARYESPSIAGNSTSNAPTKVIYGRHKVVRGDSLSTIAQRYGISLRELKRLNNIRHNTAMLGVKLKVPVSKSGKSPVKGRSANASKASSSSVHVVKRGDSLSKISAHYNVTIAAIKRANALKSNTLIKGQKLQIPGSSKQATKPRQHKVKRGDTLSEIAQQYGVSLVAIKKANKLRTNTVRLGQVLKIP